MYWHKNLHIIFFLTVGLSFPALANSESIKIESPEFVVMQDSIDVYIEVSTMGDQDQMVYITDTESGVVYILPAANGSASIRIALPETRTFKVESAGKEKTFKVRAVPGWYSIIPPLVAIALALIFKEVILSLFAGIFIGAIAVHGLSFTGLLKGFFSAIENYFFVALSDSGNLSVIMFSVGIGGMVSVISRNGGMKGVVDKLSVFANSARNAQLVTWLMGIAIFFDDFANTLIVGNTMRPVMDKYKVSREKLAYIVDSTAAPIAALAFITTWIGAELGYISKASASLGINEGAYSMFINSLQYAYYPVFTLIFMFIILWKKKDFGPMHKAELDTRNATGNGITITKSKKVEKLKNDHFKPVDVTKTRWYNGFVPVLTIVLVTILGLVITGLDSIESNMISGDFAFDKSMSIWSQLGIYQGEQGLSFFRKVGILIGEADSYKALLWATFSGITIAIGMTVSQGIMNFNDSMESLIEGFKTMVPAMLILIMAWSLSEVTTELKTAEFMTSIFKENVNPIFMPVITFILAGLIAFSTGSSWGTMAILYPLALPTTWVLCLETGMPESEAMAIFYHVIAVVLAGSVLGDHCSPISDTTIMSSLASQCYHIDHVRTQLPYALSVGGISVVLSSLAHLINFHWTLQFAIGVILIYLLVRIVGKDVPDYKGNEEEI